MDRTLRQHIDELERRIGHLTAKLMDDNGQNLADRNRAESEIRVAQLALDYYRKAVELEAQLRSRP